MIGTNLSTRPFYNVRAVRLALAAAALAVVLLTVLNVSRLLALRTDEGQLSTRATEAREQANSLRNEALRVQAQVDPQELETIATAARDANTVIEQRVFSWTTFLSELESTLPDGVRVTSIQPYVDAGHVQVSLTVHARRATDLSTFMNALESDSTFRDVLPPSVRYADDGIIEAQVRAVYLPPGAPDAAQPLRGDEGAQP